MFSHQDGETKYAALMDSAQQGRDEYLSNL